jgi:D-arabinose 1-dehydrogenase-like Zn-dependent alcohol dehydrogenase
MMLGAPEKLTLADPAHMIMGMHSVQAWYSGTAIDSQDTLDFSVLTGVRPMNEVKTKSTDNRPAAKNTVRIGTGESPK